MRISLYYRIGFLVRFQKVACCLALVCLLFISCIGQKVKNYNLNFEEVDSLHQPVGWTLPLKEQSGLLIHLDSNLKQEGRYSLSISKSKDSKRLGPSYILPAPVKGEILHLTGFVKSENVTGGYAGLWIRVDDAFGDMLGLNNIKETSITGTHDWAKYDIEIPYEAADANNIIVGALITGSGKIWVDNLTVSVDDQLIQHVALKKNLLSSLSGKFELPTLKCTPEKIHDLANVGALWGFIKYNHPNVVAGGYNMDEELSGILSEILESKSSAESNRLLEKWVDGFGSFRPCPNCPNASKDQVKLKPDYGYLFKPGNFPESLAGKVSFIRDNHPAFTDQHYVTLTKGNDFGLNANVIVKKGPVFQNEVKYSNSPYPNLKLRLLSLYRYWNMIRYFYPYRYLIVENWDSLLEEFIPKFINAKNKGEYSLTCLELICRVKDSHADILGFNPTLDTLKGVLMTPFQAKFIAGKLIVTGYYSEWPGLENRIQPGDIISRIEDTSVDVLMKKYLKLTPGSNYSTQLRDLPSRHGFLLRSNDSTAHLYIFRKGKGIETSVHRIPVTAINPLADYLDFREQSGYRLINKDIGYIYPAKLNANDIESVKTLFKDTRGVVMDLRCYPAVFMPFIYGSWLKSVSSPFARFRNITLGMPGAILDGDEVSNGGNSDGTYKGKLVIIVNSVTQSQGEYTAMALGAVPGAEVIGDTTAGADGDVSEINLPGGIQTRISGLGVYYPDNSETQRVGIKIDLVVRPTIKGVLEGRDELLEKAQQLITGHN